MPLLGCSVPRTLCLWCYQLLLPGLGGCCYRILQQESIECCPGSGCSLPPCCLQQVWGGEARVAGVCWPSSVPVSPCWQGSRGAPVAEHLPLLAAGMALCSGQASCASGRVAMSQCSVALGHGTDDDMPLSPAHGCLADTAGMGRTVVDVPGSSAQELLTNPRRDFFLLQPPQGRTPGCCARAVRGGDVPMLETGSSGTGGDGHNWQ